MPETPFDNVEAAHEYVGLLLETVGQARTEVAHDLEEAKTAGAARQVEALQLVAFKLERLEVAPRLQPAPAERPAAPSHAAAGRRERRRPGRGRRPGGALGGVAAG